LRLGCTNKKKVVNRQEAGAYHFLTFSDVMLAWNLLARVIPAIFSSTIGQLFPVI
jgi:hypothetical protein